MEDHENYNEDTLIAEVESFRLREIARVVNETKPTDTPDIQAYRKNRIQELKHCSVAKLFIEFSNNFIGNFPGDYRRRNSAMEVMHNENRGYSTPEDFAYYESLQKRAYTERDKRVDEAMVKLGIDAEDIFHWLEDYTNSRKIDFEKRAKLLMKVYIELRRQGHTHSDLMK